MKKRIGPFSLEKEVVKYVVQVKAYFEEDGRSFRGFTDIVQEVKTRKVNASALTGKLKELFKERKDLVLGFKSFMPDELQFDVDDKHEGSEHNSYSVGQEDHLLHQCCNGFKKRKSDKDSSDLGRKDDSRAKVERKSMGSKDGSDNDGNNMEKVYRQVFKLFEKVKSRLGQPDEYMLFLKHVHHYNSKQIGLSDLLQSLTKLCPNLGDEFEELLHNMEKSNKVKHKRQKIMDKSIHELDFSGCEHCTPSYWRPPKEFVVSKSRQGSDLDSQVLNDEWVCRASASRNFKLRRLNKFEKVLNQCEDERYEADMKVNSLESVVEMIGKLLEGEHRIDFETPFNINDHLSILNLKVIGRECGVEVMNELSEKPDVWLPIVLSKLKKKLDELKQDRADCSLMWASVYAKCHMQLQRDQC